MEKTEKRGRESRARVLDVGRGTKAERPEGRDVAEPPVMQAVGNLAMQRSLTADAERSRIPVARADDHSERQAEDLAARALSSPAPTAMSPVARGGLPRLPGLSHGGTSLPEEVRGFFEPRLGVDLSDVRLHTGNPAARAARAIRARAFTFGGDLFFGEREYSPESHDGRRLLAHELAHVAQQRSGLLGSPRIQRQPAAGNEPAAPEGTYVDQAVSQLGGVPAIASPFPLATAPAVKWTAPFELGTVDDRPGASVALIDIASKLQELKDAGFNEMDRVIKRGWELAIELSGGDPLTREEADKLRVYGLLAVLSHNRALNEMKDLIGAALAKWVSVSVDHAADEAAEGVHGAFMGTPGAGNLADMKAMLGKIKELGKTISNYAGYASMTKSVIKRAEKVEALKKVHDGIVGKIGEAEKLVGLVESIGTLTGKANEMPGKMQGDIAEFKAAFNVIDFVFSKSKVPLIGEWWSEFIKPTAEIALNQVQKLHKLADEAVRNNEARIDEWWQQAQRGGGPPQIATIPLVENYFPFGQEMLNFMWSVFRGDATEVPRSIERHFVQFKTQFGEGHDEEDKVPTEGGAVWYKPWSWYDEERAPKLLDWVKRHREEVWAMLYGRLPHP